MNFRFLILLAIAFCIGSQVLEAETNNTGKINGRLIDRETKNVLDYVNVTLYKKGSTKPYKVTISDSKGTFAFSDVAIGSYSLEIGFIGYLSYNKIIELSAGNELNLGDILLKTDSKLLNTVEVKGIRSNMKLEIDKKTFSVDQSIAAAGANASDILKDIPSVEVDAEGTISLRNSESVTVWINGKPSGLTSDNRGQVLEQMPAENIDRVEIITNPSAKFSPEGSAGIINIILKKERKSGYYGSLSAGINSPWGKNFGGNINYSSTTLDAYANIGLRDDEHDGYGSSKRQIYLPDTSYLNSNTKMNRGGNGLFMRTGFDYHLNKKHTLSLSGFAMDGSHNSNNDITYDYLDKSNNLSKKQKRVSKSDTKHNNYNITMDYLWEIAEGHSLQASLSHGKQINTENDTYDQTSYDSTEKIINKSYQIQTGPSNSEDWDFKADYSKKFSERWKLEAGVSSEWQHKYSDNDIFNGIANGDDWTILSIPDVSSGFDYDEQENAIYGTLTGKINSKFGYQLGLRGEQTIVSFYATDINGADTPVGKKYFDFFPTIFINYNIAEGSDLQINYSKRINRPRGRQINPFVDISDSTSIKSGNPDLNPEYAHSFEINYMKNGQKHTFSSSVYYRMTDHVIQNIQYMENGIMYQKPSNVTNSTASGLELVSKDKIIKTFETTSTVNLYYSTMEAFTYRNYKYEGTNGFSWNARINGTMIFSKGFSGQISGSYSAPKILAQGKNEGFYTMDLGLRKSFFDSKIQVSINAKNILNSFKMENSTWGQGFYQETSNHYFGRDIRLNLTWNFGNLKPKQKPKRRIEENSENSIDTGNEY
jgi:hypothetical protein